MNAKRLRLLKRFEAIETRVLGATKDLHESAAPTDFVGETLDDALGNEPVVELERVVLPPPPRVDGGAPEVELGDSWLGSPCGGDEDRWDLGGAGCFSPPADEKRRGGFDCFNDSRVHDAPTSLDADFAAAARDARLSAEKKKKKMKKAKSGRHLHRARSRSRDARPRGGSDDSAHLGQ
jgi:hypothetical protein